VTTHKKPAGLPHHQTPEGRIRRATGDPQDQDDDSKEEAMTAKTRTIWTFAITSVAVFMATLDNLVVTTALPVIRKDLHATVESLE
jgi:hypothetical protein